MAAFLIGLEDALLEELAGGGAHFVDCGEAHAATLVQIDIETRRLEGGGPHATHVLGQVGGGYGAGAGGLDGKARGRRRE